eukprot:CAMPEP_0205804342 /NCGR_PEP_ID=MMETSP0205-20121125/7236_1 /ASSEMBLY_ACC=CAM_ASM_000278 /TAXON_ID=36767 /ORGANISM="Euplotes focardii, Strain TN1" /LENGTH=47 /DNA_ID= /DNA_START= /DNA_END= /DNA_ORIENTATION=
MARLLTQIAYLQGYFTNFVEFFGKGEMTSAGTQIGLLASAVIGVTVN